MGGDRLRFSRDFLYDTARHSDDLETMQGALIFPLIVAIDLVHDVYRACSGGKADLFDMTEASV